MELSETNRQLIEAAITLMRAQGYNATTLDAICAAAGVTKGGFFHYFKSKEAIALAALRHFHHQKWEAGNHAPFSKLLDPLERVYGRIEYAQAAEGGTERPTKGCLIGMLAQELALTHPKIRAVCQELFLKIAADFEAELAMAKKIYAAEASEIDPEALAQLYLAINQGGMILAKTGASNAILNTSLRQFRIYLHSLFGDVKTGPNRVTGVGFDPSNN